MIGTSCKLAPAGILLFQKLPLLHFFFSIKRSQPAPDEYVYMSFNYFEGNKRVYYCFNPTGKEWDIFYLVRDFNMKNDTINRDKWLSFFNIGGPK